MSRAVEFSAGDGTTLRGRLHLAEGRATAVIVMSHGFGGIAAQLDHYAALFCKSGFTVLVYDHRGFGASDGAIRQEVDPHVQLDDWRDAITFATLLPETDADCGVGVWGSSFAGGLAMVLAATDPRVRCAVSQVPNVSGHRNGLQLFTSQERETIARLATEDRISRTRGAPPMLVPSFPRAGEFGAFMRGVPDTVLQIATQYPDWRNEVTVRSLEHLVQFEPGGWAPFVHCPLLMVVAENDVCTFTDVQLEVFQDIPAPSELVCFDGNHFDAYREFFRETSEPARRWFEQHLAP